MVLQPFFNWLHRHDREFQGLVAETQQLHQQVTDGQQQKAVLDEALARSEQELTAAAACRQELTQELTTTVARKQELEQELAAAAARRQVLEQRAAMLEEEVRRETWAGRVLNDDFIAGRVSPQRKHAWLVAAPKSGSTWLTGMLVQLLGWQPHMLVAVWDRREQEIDVRRMLEFPDANLFSIQQHCRFSAPTRDFLRKFRVQVILQGRNLWDSVVSFRDHLLKESTVTPVCFIDDTFRSLPPERQIDRVIDLAVPWYFSFYASWFMARQAGEADFLWIDYESLCRDTPGQLRRIAAYLGISRSDAEIDKAMNKAAEKPMRFNVGRTGRGEETLTQQQKDRIAHLRSYYPQIDFSPIGLA